MATEDIFEKRRKQLGLSSSGPKQDSSMDDAFTRRRMDLGLIPDTRPKSTPQLPKTQAQAHSFGNDAIDQFQGKLPAASLLTVGTGGPSRASQITGNTRFDQNRREIEDSKAPSIVKSYANVMNNLVEGNPVGRFLSRALPSDPTVQQDSTGNKTADRVAGFLKQNVTPILTPTGAPIGQGIIGGSYDAAGKALSKGVGQKAVNAAANLIPMVSASTAQTIARVGLTEGIAGAAQGVGLGLQNGQDSGREIIANAGLGAAGGLVLGAGGAALGEAGRTVLGRLRPAANAVEETVQPTVRPVERTTPNVNETTTIPSQIRQEQPARTPVMDREPVTPIEPVRQQTPREAEIMRKLDNHEPMSQDDIDYMLQVSEESAAPTIESPSEKPVSVSVKPELAPPMEPQTNTRSNFKNQLDNGNFSGELQEKIKNTDQTYDVAHNVDSVAKANENLKNLPEAEAKFLNNESGGADHIATGYRLMQELDKTGEYERALAVSKKLAADLTKAGQTSQAASILSRLSPEGQLLNLIRTAEKNGKTVSTADSVKFKQLAAKVQDDSGAGVRSNQVNDILDKMERGENVSESDMKKLEDFITRANEKINPKKVSDNLPKEFNDVRKRDKVISFLDDAEQAAWARIKARRGNLNSLPLAEWADYTVIVASKIGKGAIKAETHIEDMVKLFGEEIRPVATQVFQRAQHMVNGVSKSAAEGNLEKANQIMRKVSGKAENEKAAVREMSSHVRKLIDDAKQGNIQPEDVQKLRDYSDEIAEMLEEKQSTHKMPSNEERFLQSVKSLAKKISQVETEKISPDQANREISSLIRQVAKIADETEGKIVKEPINTQALSDIAHDVMEKTRPNPKPTTLQEKLVEKYAKQNPNVTESDLDTLRQLAKDVNRLSGDDKIDADIAMQKILNSYEKSSSWDKINAIRYMAMLLNTSTQTVNALSGLTMASKGAIADVFGTMIDIAMNKTLKTPRSVTTYGTNPLKFIARLFKNAKVGAKAGAVGANPLGIQNIGEVRGLAFKSTKNPLSILERGLGAVAKGADYATYKSVYDSEIVKKGYLDAINKGITGKSDIKAHIERFVNDPPEEAILDADRIGKNTTFQRSDSTGGKVANWLNSSPTIAKPLVTSVFPFVRTPINIASAAVTETPGGIIKGLYQLSSKSQASQREALRTLSMGITGTGMSALGFYLSYLGIITGANDSGDKELDNLREQVGEGKYRFNTSALSRYLKAMFNGEGEDAAEAAAKYREGDKQFDYNKLQPLAFPLAIGAGLQDNKEKGAAQALAGAGTDAFGSLYGMSTLKGVQDVFQPSYGGSVGEKALGVPTRIGESFLKSFSPSALAQEARREDPIMRKTAYNDGIVKDVSDYFQSRTPGLSQKLQPNKTTLGQNKKNAPGIVGQYLNPYKSDVAPYNQAAKIINDLIDRTGDTSLAPAPPEKSVRGKNSLGDVVTIKIPGDRYSKLQEDIGNGIIEKIMDLPKGYSDEELSKKIEKIYSKVREKEMKKVKKELGLRTSS